MKPAHRSALRTIPILLQLFAAASAWAVIDYFLPAATAFAQKHQELQLPAYTLLVANYPGTVKAGIVVLLVISWLTSKVSARKLNDEADTLVMVNAIQALVWFLGVVLVGGVLVASALPFLVLQRT